MHAYLGTVHKTKQSEKPLSFLAHLFPVAHLTFRGGKGGREKEERKNLALRRSVERKKVAN